MGDRKRTDLASAVDDVGRVATGVVGRLLGPKAVGKQDLEEMPLDPRIDRAVTKVGDAVGRVLQAVGHGLESHPLDPEQAVHDISSRLREKAPPEKKEGWSAFSTGIETLVGGVGVVADRVIDRVSAELQPKKAQQAEEAAAASDTSQVTSPLVEPSPTDLVEPPVDDVVVPASEAETLQLTPDEAAGKRNL